VARRELGRLITSQLDTTFSPSPEPESPSIIFKLQTVVKQRGIISQFSKRLNLDKT
jgi:hypothetical protein